MQVAELTRYGATDAVLRAVQALGIDEIWEYQRRAFEAGILQNKSVVTSIPTGSGKTLPALAAIAGELSRGERALYVVPLRSLAREKFQLLLKIGSVLEKTCDIATGDFAAIPPAALASADALIATTEKVDSLLRRRDPWFARVHLLVVDELQTVGDDERGLTVEIVVSELRRRRPEAQVIGLSAVLGNPDDFRKWLKADLVLDTRRQIPLYEGVLAVTGTLRLVDYQTREARQITVPLSGNKWQKPSPHGDPQKRERYSNTIDLVLQLAEQNVQSLIFVNSRESAEELAEQLSLHLSDVLDGESLRKCEELVTQLGEVSDAATRFTKKLASMLLSGVAFHHAGLSLDNRELVERAFTRGDLKAIVSTPTLAQGVNLPAKAVIVADYVRFDSELGQYVTLGLNEMINMLGRAGRPDFHNEGWAIIVGDSQHYDDLVRGFLGRTPEPVLSTLKRSTLRRKHVLGLIAGNKPIWKAELKEILGHTLYAVQLKERFGEEVQAALDEDLRYLEENGFIKVAKDFVTPTNFGEITARSYISPEASLLFRRAVTGALRGKKGTTLTCWQLFQTLLLSPDVPIFRPFDESEGYQIVDAMRQHGHPPLLPFPEDAASRKDYARRSLAAQVMCQWCEEVDEDALRERWPELHPMDFQTWGESIQWLAEAFNRIWLLEGGSEELALEIQTQAQRAPQGVRPELIPLVEVEGIGRKRARKLFEAGFRSLQDLAQASHDQVATITNRLVANNVLKFFSGELEGEYREPERVIAQSKDEVTTVMEENQHIEERLEQLDEFLSVKGANEEETKRLKLERLLTLREDIDKTVIREYGETACVMFTDIRNFTEFTQKYGDITSLAVVSRHERVLPQIAKKHGGRLIKTIGDSLLIVFGSPVDGVDAAIEMEQAWNQENRETPPEYRLEIGIGLDHGDILSHGGDVHGARVNRAARIASYAKASEILVPGEVFAELDANRKARCVSIGKVSLKGITPDPELFHIEWV